MGVYPFVSDRPYFAGNTSDSWRVSASGWLGDMTLSAIRANSGGIDEVRP